MSLRRRAIVNSNSTKIVESGICGNYDFNVDNTATYTIDSNGLMFIEGNNIAQLPKEVNSFVNKIKIQGVKTLGWNRKESVTLNYKDTLEYVEFSDDLVTLETNAFRRGLTGGCIVKLPQSLTTIARRVFFGCGTSNTNRFILDLRAVELFPNIAEEAFMYSHLTVIVPDELYDDYVAAGGYRAYNCKYIKASEYEEA